MTGRKGSSDQAHLEQITIDTRTGKIVEPGGSARIDFTRLTDADGTEVEARFRRKERYDCGEGKFVITFIELHREMLEKKVRGVPRSVMDWLTIHIETDNIVVGVLQKDIAAELGIRQPNVSEALTYLERLRFIFRGKAGVIWLNPRHVFLGTAKDQIRCARLWDERWAQRMREQMHEVSA